MQFFTHKGVFAFFLGAIGLLISSVSFHITSLSHLISHDTEDVAFLPPIVQRSSKVVNYYTLTGENQKISEKDPPKLIPRNSRKTEKENVQGNQQAFNEESGSSLRAPRKIAPSNSYQKVIVMTFVFGKQTGSKRALRMFAESARNAGVDFAMIGDAVLPYELPSNFRFFNISWDGFVDRIFEKIRDGKETTRLRKAGYRKTCDFTPVMGYLFPEIAEGYDWWGHIDSDVIIGNMTKFVPQELLQNNDIISGQPSTVAWGPFTLFRNTPVVNELFRLSPEPLEKNLLDHGNNYFDEWGNNDANRFNFSIAGIITNEGPRLNLRTQKGTYGEITWDKRECLFKYGEDKIPEWCNECIYDKGTLRYGLDKKEILFCHFHASKKRPQHEESLQNDAKLKDLVTTQQFRVGWLEGFDYLDTPEAQKLKAASGQMAPQENTDKARENELVKEKVKESVKHMEAPMQDGKIHDIELDADEITGQTQEELEKVFYQKHFDSLHKIELPNMPVWGARQQNFGISYKHFLERFPYKTLPSAAEDAQAVLKSKGRFFFAESICHAANAFQQYRNEVGSGALPHVLLFRFHEDFGGFASSVDGKTKSGHNIIEIWGKEGCTKEFIWEYLDHPDTLGAFTNQFQAFYHPKVYSIPIGFRAESNAIHIRKSLGTHQEKPWSFKNRLLMINSKPRPQRAALLDGVISGFQKVGVNLHNSYDNKRGGIEKYYMEMEESRFIMSPSGSGWDCYRHYEGIYLGAIPIIEHANRVDGWYRSLDNLPVAWIDAYENLTPEWLEKEYQKILNRVHSINYEKMTKQWWIDFVYSHLEISLASKNPDQYWVQVSKPGGLAHGFEKAYFERHPGEVARVTGIETVLGKNRLSEDHKQAWAEQESVDKQGTSKDPSVDTHASVTDFYKFHFEKVDALANFSSMLFWDTRNESTPFGPLWNELGYVYKANGIKEPDLKASKFIFWGSICEAAKAFTDHRLTEGAEPLPHVLFFRMNENWGGFSETVPNKTAEWTRDLEGEWKKQGCSKEMIFAYLDHPDTLAAITMQFQVYDHPKVHSLPLGIKDLDQARFLIDRLENKRHERTQLLMINSKPRAMRDAAINKVVQNFHGTVNNTYGLGGKAQSFQNYYDEMQRSKFIMSPGGLGFDCYRHWEALYMGTIPVLEHLNRKDGWFRTFDGLPVAWIDSFDNLTPEFLEREYFRITANAHNYKYEKLTKSYWVDFIKSLVSTPSEDRKERAISHQERPEVDAVDHLRGLGDAKRDEMEKTFYQKQFDRLSDVELPNMLLWGAREQFFGYSYKFFLDRFPYKTISENEEGIAELVKTSPFVYAKSICHAAKAFHKHWSQAGAEALPHILLFRFHEDFGGFAISVDGKTKAGHNCLEIWKKQGCTKDFIWEYLDHPDTLVGFTNQFQAFYHPKVYSVPIGNRAMNEVKHIKKNLLTHKNQPWTFKKKMLMINSKPRPQRAPILDGIISRFQDFGISLKNTYDNKRNGHFTYYSEMEESRFIVSPSGSGWDCYRHYEAIYLGVIPIIEHDNRTDGWYRSLDNLPVAWIDSYANLTPEWLESEYHKILQEQESINFKKMTNRWWIDFAYSHLESGLAREDPAKYWTEMSKPGGLAEGFERAYFERHPEHQKMRLSDSLPSPA